MYKKESSNSGFNGVVTDSKFFGYFAITYLLALMGFFTSLQSALNLPITNFVYLILYSCTFYFAATSIKRLDLARFFLVSFLFVAGLLISAGASYQPITASYYVFVIFVNVLFSFILTGHVTPENISILILRAIIVVLFSSLILALVDYKLIIYSDPIDRSYLLGIPNIKGLHQQNPLLQGAEYILDETMGPHNIAFGVIGLVLAMPDFH